MIHPDWLKHGIKYQTCQDLSRFWAAVRIQNASRLSECVIYHEEVIARGNEIAFVWRFVRRGEEAYWLGIYKGFLYVWEERENRERGKRKRRKVISQTEEIHFAYTGKTRLVRPFIPLWANHYLLWRDTGRILMCRKPFGPQKRATERFMLGALPLSYPFILTPVALGITWTSELKIV